MLSPFTPMQHLARCKVIRITESGKLLLIKFGILPFGIRNSAQGIGIPLRLGSGIQVALSCRNLESRIWKPEYTVWNPESKPEKTDDISRRHHWFPREMTPEKKSAEIPY